MTWMSFDSLIRKMTPGSHNTLKTYRAQLELDMLHRFERSGLDMLFGVKLVDGEYQTC